MYGADRVYMLRERFESACTTLDFDEAAILFKRILAHDDVVNNVGTIYSTKIELTNRLIEAHEEAIRRLREDLSGHP